MNKQYFCLVYTICCLLAYGSSSASVGTGVGPVIFSGSMRFPHMLKRVPAVRVYWSGHRIACQADKLNNMLHFTIPGLRQQRSLYLVIAKDVCFKTENNVIHYLYLTKETPYKFYYLELCEQFDAAAKKTKFAWVTKEIPLLTDVDGNYRLPDDTILVYYDPKLIEGLEGGDALDLPTIRVVANIPERLLHDKSDNILCAALTMDAVHRELQHEMRPSLDHKTIVTITT